jgi:surfeit locus 1 family protein
VSQTWVGNVRISPRTIVGAVLLFALVLVFIALGCWQLQRAQYKQALQRQYDSRAAGASVALGQKVLEADNIRFRRVAVRGEYDPSYQILIDNRVHRGQAGYHVVTPLRIENGDTRVLVNRGWVPMGPSREHLPAVDPPAGMQEISGVAVVPAQDVFKLGDEEPRRRGWQPVWQHLDMARYAASVPFMTQPIVILLDSAHPTGYIREWPRLDAGIAVHHGYAFQWFALAVMTMVILVVMARRKWWRKSA